MNNLLFIDDEEGIRRSVSRALRRSVYSVHTAASGTEGVALVKEAPERISTVISDYKMPGLNGLDTLSQIGGINPDITRIILTGYATMDVAIDATNKGIDGFLTKPFDNAVLRANIHEISLRKRLKQFVSDQIYQKIQEAPDALQPVYHEATVLFVDIRGFTRMSMGIPPEKIATFLNEQFFTPMGKIAFAHDGTVDKHIGDSIMVVFGAPVTHPEDPHRAVRAAIAMQQQANKINQTLRATQALHLNIGIGIATGNVFSGVLGSLQKKEYTSVGTAVNMASRLQDMANSGEILISEDTFQKLNTDSDSPVKVHPLPPTTIKGFDRPVTIYKVESS